MNIEIRLEKPEDYRETENLTREAFWDLYKPGCDEHLLLHNIRQVPSFVEELDFVAVLGDKIIGNVIYSRGKVVDELSAVHEVLCMGPLSVLPHYQDKGVGSKLVIHSTGRAGEMGFKGVVIFGNPGYYHRFGYKNASAYKITTSDGDNFDAFMALELYKESLKGVEGRFYPDPVFIVDEKELNNFEKEFPYREKHVTDTQLV